MRDRLILLVMMAILSIAESVAAFNVGYCNGESSKTSSFSVDGNCNVSGAIYLPPTFLKSYDGCEATALRVALASKVNIDEVTLWIRDSIDGENLVETKITSKTEPSLAKGWLETPLSTPFTIDSTRGLYLGMTYHQKAAAKVFSLIGSGFENSFFAKLSDSDTWQDMHGEGILSIEMAVEGEVSIDYDLALIEAVADASSDPGNNVVTVKVANNGEKDLSGFTLACSYSDSEENPYEFHFEEEVASGDKRSVVCRVPRKGDLFSNPMSVSLVSIDNGEDAISDNNSVSVTLTVVKKVFVEEYTTERCSNCPRVAGYLHEILEEDKYKDNVVAVCHHSGFYTDWLTQPCDEDMERFFGVGFAPAVSYDRYPYFNNGSIIHCPEKSDFRNMFDKCLDKSPNVAINVAPEFSVSDRTLDVKVSLQRLSNSIANPYVTIYITEDEIAPVRQSGNEAGTHVHRHVIRAYNSTWGDPVEWTGSRFTASYTFDIDPGWKEKDMKAVVIVGNRNADDKTDNIIDNAEAVRIVSENSSVDTVEDAVTVVSVEYRDINGFRVNEDASGFLIKIEKLSDGTARSVKIMKKVL